MAEGKIRLQEAYSSGLAYFKVGNRDYMQERDGRTHPTVPVDYHPMLTQFDRLNPLAEKDREFLKMGNLQKYLAAINKFDVLVRRAADCGDSRLSRALRNKIRRHFYQLRRELKLNYVSTLRTIPQFAYVSSFLDMEPEEICEKLENRAI